VRVLVTGGNGFLGRHVVAELERRGHQIIAPRSKQHDLTTPEGVTRALDMFGLGTEVVVHLAARVGGIGANVAHPAEFFYENAIMGIELMEQAMEVEVKKFVTVGTACCYPADAPTPQREEDLWKGYPVADTAPYAMAKKMLLVQSQAYRQEYGFNAIYLIPTNLYGPGDNFDLETGHVIPSLVRKFVDAVDEGSVRVPLWGTGLTTRDFLYVTDAAYAIAEAMERYDQPEPMNIGTGVEVRIDYLARLIARLTGYQGAMMWNADKPSGQARRCLDVTRMRDYLGVGRHADTLLTDGLQDTIDYWRREKH
jgi:GDP-L-fucose synthase